MYCTHNVSLDSFCYQCPFSISKEDTHYSLLKVLLDAYYQSKRGKGLERHGSHLTRFEDQPIITIASLFEGNAGHGQAFQAVKKISESTRFIAEGKFEQARFELLGAIVYIAAMAITLTNYEEEEEEIPF